MALVVVFVVVPLIELALVIEVASRVGVIPAVLLLLFFSAAGAWLTKREGTTAFRRIQDGLAAGRMPTTEVIDGFLVMLGGAMMLVPGFLTDLLGLLLMIPPVRAMVRGLAGALIAHRVARRVRITGARLGGDDPTLAGRYRAYRRPGEPPVGDFRRTEVDVIDVDGEEIILTDPVAELSPPHQPEP